MVLALNRATAITRIIAKNCLKSHIFDRKVIMYVYEEEIDEKNLSDIINQTHENVKYLPGYKLTKNVVRVLFDFAYCIV